MQNKTTHCKRLRNWEKDMASLEETAKQYNAREKSDKNEFQRRARLLQSIWRENKGFGMRVVGKRMMGSRLAEEDANRLHNFLTEPIRQAVWETLNNRKDGQMIDKSRLLANLLSSQPLCFNLFGELATRGKLGDFSSATKIFAELMQKPLRSVTYLEFEKSHGRGKAALLHDRTAFDFYVEYELTSGENGFLGIEVKYHENLVGREWIDAKGRHKEMAIFCGSGSVAAEEPRYRPNTRYIEVADQSGWFRKGSYPNWADRRSCRSGGTTCCQPPCCSPKVSNI